MKLAVSNIAWTNDEEPEVAALLQKLGVKYIEIAPTKKWEDPTKATKDEIRQYVDFWKSYEIEIVAFQSMLFSRPNLKIFESSEDRLEAESYLKDFTRLAGDMGAGIMVFGSPKNRQRGEMPNVDAVNIARPFFDAIGTAAASHNVCFCIEPNATDYACDFVTTAQEGINIVKAVANPGFGLHLDIACMSLAGDDIEKSILQAAPSLKHFHISSPMLGDVKEGTNIDHETAARALRAIGYDNYVSIEMRPAPEGNLKRVEEAVKFAQAVYN